MLASALIAFAALLMVRAIFGVRFELVAQPQLAKSAVVAGLGKYKRTL